MNVQFQYEPSPAMKDFFYQQTPRKVPGDIRDSFFALFGYSDAAFFSEMRVLGYVVIFCDLVLLVGLLGLYSTKYYTHFGDMDLLPVWVLPLCLLVFPILLYNYIKSTKKHRDFLYGMLVHGVLVDGRIIAVESVHQRASRFHCREISTGILEATICEQKYEARFRTSISVLGLMMRFCREHGTPVALVYLPSDPTQMVPLLVYENVRHVSKNDGAAVMDKEVAMGNVEIRTTKESDLPQIAEIHAQFWEPPEVQNVERMREKLPQLLNNPAYILLSAIDGDAVLGSVMGVVVEDLYGQCQPFLVVENMIVDKKARGRGVGKTIFAEMEARAKEKGCRYVILVTEADRKDAMAFYPSIGFHPTRNMGFKKYLH